MTRPLVLISVNPRDSRPIYVQIMDEVRRARVLGIAGPNDPLPSVRQLAADLRVNPNTVQQAYRELEREGLVYVRRGQGTFLADAPLNGKERDALARRVAERALLEAHRSGLSAAELVRVIGEIAAESPSSSPPPREEIA